MTRTEQAASLWRDLLATCNAGIARALKAWSATLEPEFGAAPCAVRLAPAARAIALCNTATGYVEVPDAPAKKPRRKTRNLEHLEQCVVIQWARLNQFRYPDLELLHAIPNGGGRTAAEAGRLKAEGVKPGVSDLCLPAARGYHHGLYIEMKAAGGVPSKEQIAFLNAVERNGYAAHVIIGATRAIEVLELYLKLPRWER